MISSPTVSLSKPTKLSPKGSPSERLWIIAEEPLSKDKDRGFLFSSAMGWSYDKLLHEAGLSSYYCTYFESEAEALAELDRYRPPLIVCLDTSSNALIPNIQSREQVGLWASSLLISSKLSYPHYIIPTFGPETCISDWTERQVVKYIDYGKIRGELDFWQQHHYLQPLPSRKLVIDLPLPALLFEFAQWLANPAIQYLSVDIETIYPKEKSEFYGHPGYPVTVGIAISPSYGISFSLFQDTTENTIRLWRALATLLAAKEIIGQNFHAFDAWFFEMLGMPINRFKIQDTMFRHAVLWPELSHKLQFQTRQYTRQPYYKSEGHGWSMKDMDRLKRYNALDCCTTFEIWLEQEKEFDERPHLR